MTTKKQTRSNNVRLNLADNVYDRLLRMADDLGMPHSTLASYAVSEWLKTKEAAFGVSDRIVEGSLLQLKTALDSAMQNDLPKTEDQLSLMSDAN